MKKITLFLAAFGLVSIGFAQVHVINDAFIYSKGTNIFVTKEIGLRDAPVVNATVPANNKPGSAIYMREEAQLRQLDATEPNSGAGTFSVFQEGVANNFTYNYWSSPVHRPVSNATDPKGFSNTQMFFPLLTENFTTETDLVINAQRATILPTNVRDGRTDRQVFETSGSPKVNDELRIAGRWLYSYNSVDAGAGNGGISGYSGYRPFVDANELILPGYGFTMKGVVLDTGGDVKNIKSSGVSGSGQRYDFRGIPNNGDISVGVKSNDFSIVGNPYHSDLDLKQFMEDNPNQIDGQLYFWDSQSTTHILTEYLGGFGTYSPQIGMTGNGYYVDPVFRRYDSQGVQIPGSGGTTSGGLSGPLGDGASRRYAAVGQGFVILRSIGDDPSTIATGDGFPNDGSSGTVTFKNSQRFFQKENGDSSLFKSAPGSSNDQTANNEADQLNPAMSFEVIINNQYSRNMIVAFNDSSTLGWDWGMDASNIGNRTNNDSFMAINNSQALIQVLPYNESETFIPMAFKSVDVNSKFQIKITGLENFSPNAVLLHDKTNNTYHDILNDSFTVETGKGNTNDRYEIVFQEKSTLSTDDVALASGFAVFQNNPESLLTVRNADRKDIRNISVFDLSGRLVNTLTPKDISDEYTFNTTTYAVGVYIVKVTTGDNEESATKVIVSN